MEKVKSCHNTPSTLMSCVTKKHVVKKHFHENYPVVLNKTYICPCFDLHNPNLSFLSSTHFYPTFLAWNHSKAWSENSNKLTDMNHPDELFSLHWCVCFASVLNLGFSILVGLTIDNEAFWHSIAYIYQWCRIRAKLGNPRATLSLSAHHLENTEPGLNLIIWFMPPSPIGW